MTIRYSALKEANISDAALADSLKELQENGIVVHHRYNEIPVRIEYLLSDKGKTSLPILDVILEWAVKYGKDETIYKGKHFEEVHSLDFKKFEK